MLREGLDVLLRGHNRWLANGNRVVGRGGEGRGGEGRGGEGGEGGGSKLNRICSRDPTSGSSSVLPLGSGGVGGTSDMVAKLNIASDLPARFHHAL